MTLAAAPDAPAAARRQRALSDFIERLRDRSPALDPWLASQTRAFFGGAAAADAVPALVVQGLALGAKCADDIRRFDALAGAGREAVFAVEAELMLDLSLGVALQRDVQAAIDEAVRSGGARGAKDLTRFGHELRKAVAVVRQKIALGEQRRAETLSEELTDRPRTEVVATGELRLQRVADQAAVAHERARVGRLRERALRAAAAVLPSRTEWLVVLLAIEMALWVAAVSLPRMLARPVHVITLGDLELGDPVSLVEALPPALYAVIDAARWNALTDAEQLEAVRRVSGVAQAHGYVGIVLRAPDGRPVARWLSGRGAELIAPMESVPTAPQPPAPSVPDEAAAAPSAAVPPAAVDHLARE